MKTAEMVEQLRSELRQDLENITINHRKNREMSRRISESQTADEYEFAASILEDFLLYHRHFDTFLVELKAATTIP
ncbi:MAG: hypothetical protein WCY01_01175 [Alkalispirochaeta sp.]|jgi:hypothetical protein